VIQAADSYIVHRNHFFGLRARRDIAVTLRSGNFMVARGRSANGKATLLNLPACNEVPTNSAAKLTDGDARTISDQNPTDCRSDNIGYVFYNCGLLLSPAVMESGTDGLINSV
jgi:ABC-type lipoprotein export system ATPase subunit